MTRSAWKRWTLAGVLISALSCREESEQQEAGATPQPSASASPRTLVLYPGAPTAPWGEPEFFDPDSSRPKTHLELGRLEVAGPLSEDEARKSILHRENALRHCYWLALAEDPSLRATIVLEFSVDRDGKARDGKVVRTDTSNAEITSCTLERLGRFHFPERDRDTRVVVPFTFRPG